MDPGSAGTKAIEVDRRCARRHPRIYTEYGGTAPRSRAKRAEVLLLDHLRFTSERVLEV